MKTLTRNDLKRYFYVGKENKAIHLLRMSDALEKIGDNFGIYGLNWTLEEIDGLQFLICPNRNYPKGKQVDEQAQATMNVALKKLTCAIENLNKKGYFFDGARTDFKKYFVQNMLYCIAHKKVEEVEKLLMVDGYFK